MTYAKITFNAATPLSIANLNMLGSQYADMKTLVEGHNPSTYYNKTECDSRYVFADNDGHGSGANAATIDGFAKAELMASVPIGLIILYHGDLSYTNGLGWYLCDGTNGTRNIVNKYVIGADENTNLQTGGNDWFAPTCNLVVAGHTISVAEMPVHNHTFGETNYPYYLGGYVMEMGISGGWYTRTNVATVSKTSGYAGSDQAHGHTGSSYTFDAIENRPLSKAVYYIQKIN